MKSIYTTHFILPFLLAFLFSSNETYEVTGKLVDEDGSAIAEHQVLLVDEIDEQIASDQTDSEGRFTLFYQVEPTTADPHTGPKMPSEFKLGASYPNPFNPRTTVPFYSPEHTQAVITIYNILGQRLLRSHADISAGSNEIQVNLGGNFSQGQYIIRVQGEGFSLARSMTFLSAGIGDGNPEITVRQGGRASGRISGSISNSINQTDDGMEYRIVVEETDLFHGKEVTVAAFENRDVGSLELAHKPGEIGEWPRDTDTEVIEVTNPVTGRVWMDRNLGASRAATSSTDSLAYGDLYQWGRAADGHQKRDSEITSTLSDTDQPGHESFIMSQDPPYDWRSPQNNDLWQGVNGINNPCPAGYRLPTQAEWEVEYETWGSKNAAGAFESPLKLPVSGRRLTDGSFAGVNSSGSYWSSSILDLRASSLVIGNSAFIISHHRVLGRSVRCTKDIALDTYTLNLYVSPWQSGSLSGSGQYTEGAEVTITATPAAGYSFVKWSGSTDYIADEYADSTTVTMPANNISLTANFKLGEEDDDWPRDTVTVLLDVISHATGRVWMDRNLGAGRAATSNFDTLAYGDLYQWGRAADGHQKRNSPTTQTLSSTGQPGHGNFIIGSSDWRSPQNNDLWQGVDGIYNPCPAGYRLPTEAEWDAERESWSSHNAAGAFASPLKLPMAGFRSFSSGLLNNIDIGGYYWSTSLIRPAFRFHSNSYRFVNSISRAIGKTVRCTKDGDFPDPDTYSLNLDASPWYSGSVYGSGPYLEGVEVTIIATAREGYTFVNWSGDTGHLADQNAPNTTFAMPSQNISLTANFEQDYEDGDWPRDTVTEVVDVTNPATGRVWMDRNLGAGRAATSSADTLAYGDLYQWGRAADGHQLRNSSVTSTRSNFNQPGHDSFIIDTQDWRIPQNDNLWQGIDGVNNPCPTGYRLPAIAEWAAEFESWSQFNAAGAFASPLKLTLTGWRSLYGGSLVEAGNIGRYWSSDVSFTEANFLDIGIFSATYFPRFMRAMGHSVRCIKD